MRRLALFLFVVWLLLLGCGDDDEPNISEPEHHERYIMPSGTEIECVYVSGGYDGGLWCRELD